MKYMPLVTIIIPVYNGSNFLKEAIESALNQTYKNIEIIVVNDGSKDNNESENIALSYGKKIIYYKKENGGVSSALNFALKKMKGEWFSWLSHDDLYFPEKIEKQIEFINELLRKNPDIDLNKIVLHSATVSINKDGKVIKTPNYSDVNIKEDMIDVIIKNVYNYRLSGCSFLIPISAYKKIGGFREDIRTVSDVEFWYRLAFNSYNFYCLKNNILVKNRSHGRQVGKIRVTLFDQEIEALHKNIADKLNEYLPEENKIYEFERYYLGLIKRNLFEAANYTKDTYIINHISGVRNYIILPIKKIKWLIIGKIRNLMRNIYRKLNVK